MKRRLLRCKMTAANIKNNMNIELLRNFCTTLPFVTEDIKWGNDLCFSIGNKMFCAAPLSSPFSVSFKVKDGEFDELCNVLGIMPAPYVARYKWVLVTDVKIFSKKDWEHYIKQSYELVKSKLTKKALSQLK